MCFCARRTALVRIWWAHSSFLQVRRTLDDLITRLASELGVSVNALRGEVEFLPAMPHALNRPVLIYGTSESDINHLQHSF